MTQVLLDDKAIVLPLLEKTPAKSPKKKKKKMRNADRSRAQNIDEIFASVSASQASDLNPPPERLALTPRSAEACLKCGINPETLKIRDLDSFVRGDITPAVQRMRHEAYSQRRHDQMKMLRSARKKILAEEDSPSKAFVQNNGLVVASESTLVDLEKRRLEKMQFRQQREIEQMLDFELKMNRIQEEANGKIETDRKLQERREREKVQRKKEMAEVKRQKELQKRAQAEAEEERRRQLATEMFEKDRILAEERKRHDKIRDIETKNKEVERKRKAEEHRQQTEAILKKQQQEIIERLKELDHAEAVRTEMMEVQRIERAKEMEERRLEVSLRIKKNLKNARKVEHDRKKEIQSKQRQSAKLRAMMEARQVEEREAGRQEQMLLSRKRAMILEETRREEERKKQSLLRKQDETELNVRLTQEAHQRQLVLRKEQKIINKQLKSDNVERQKRVQEYQRLETLRKLREQEERTERMLQQKELLVQARRAAAIKSKIQRDTIVETMEQVKVTKKWGKATKSLNKVLGTSPSKTKKKNRPKSTDLHESKSLPALKTRTQTPEGFKMEPPPMDANFKFSQNVGDDDADEPQAYLSPYDLLPLQVAKKKKKKKKNRKSELLS